MGNRASRTDGIVLKIDKSNSNSDSSDRNAENFHTAGEMVTGTAYVSIRNHQKSASASSTMPWESVQLFLRGTEHVVMEASHNNASSSNNSDQRALQHSTFELVHSNYRLAQFPPPDAAQRDTKDKHNTSGGQYEYPFAVRLPQNLPGCMKCYSQDDNSASAWSNPRNQVRISYILTACLINKDGSVDGDFQDGLELNVRAAPPTNWTTLIQTPLRMDTQTYSPKHLWCLFQKGAIQLGWQSDSHCVTPGATLPVRVWGQNDTQSTIVSHVSVALYEIVTFQNAAASETITVQRTLAKHKIAVDAHPQWQPRSNSNSRPMPASAAQAVILGSLHIPADARNSYTGTLVQVAHKIVVKASTKGWTVTSPESTHAVQIVADGNNNSNSGAQQQTQQPTTQQLTELAAMQPPMPTPVPAPSAVANAIANEEHATPEARDDDDDDENPDPEILVQAEAVPADWQPETAPVIFLPDSAVLAAHLVGDDGESSPRNASELRASAPPESLAAAVYTPSVSYDNDDETIEVLLHRPEPTTESLVRELTRAARTCPENIPVLLLEDGDRNALAQKLTPEQLQSIILMSTSEKARYGLVYTLCAAIPKHHLTCRHVAACLQTLPKHYREQVLYQVAPNIVDMEHNFGAIRATLDRPPEGIRSSRRQLLVTDSDSAALLPATE